MKNNNGIAVLVFALLLILVFSSQGLSLSEMETVEIYKNSIERQIENCNAKIRFVDSESHNLRQYGQLELQKAEFFSNFKKVLIREMIEKNISPKDYKIQYFLNCRFYEVLD